MLEIKTKLKVPRAAYKVDVKGQLRLPFELRQKSRARVRLVSGEEMALKLPRGEMLRGGDLVVASDGRVIEIVAEPEAVLNVECASARELARAAFHLGNRHVPVEVGEGNLRIAADHVLEEMLKGLGAKVTPTTAPFEPEAGAYSGSHAHAAHDQGARIHSYGEPHDPSQGHDHDHDHDHDHCGHDHGHKHEH